MSKRIRIFLVSIAAVLVGATVLFLTINNSFISPYYIYQQRESLRVVCAELASENASMQGYIEQAEAERGVIVAVIPNTGDINQMNEQLRNAFLAKGLGLSKYWLWEEDYNSTVKNGTQQRVYGQGELGYNLLVQYLIKEQQLVAVATILPHLSRPLTISNTVSAVIMTATALLLMVLVWWMSSSLEKAQHKVEQKNKQMKQLLNHVSHDLKTPIALIKAYTSGMRDGMDDGSFLDTIAQQNDRMEQLTQRLLALSRYEDAPLSFCMVDISELLTNELKRQQPLFAAQGILVEQRIQQGISLQSSADALTTIFENILSNAAKYAAASPVCVALREERGETVLEIRNPTELPEETETNRLWEPFCVVESSRNSMLSGSGLGLSLVRAAVEAIGASCLCWIEDGQFCVQITIKANR